MLTTIICVAALAFLVFGLGFAVSMTRAKTKTTYGYEMDATKPMYKVYRAHMNSVEYAPMLALLMLFVGLVSPDTWVLWVMGITTACRYMIAADLWLGHSLEKPGPFRFLGSLGTYLGGFALIVATLLKI